MYISKLLWSKCYDHVSINRPSKNMDLVQKNKNKNMDENLSH